MIEVGFEIGETRVDEITVVRGFRGRGLAVLTAIGNFPNPTAFAIAAGVGQGDFVMADDPVVEVGHVERTVGTEDEVIRPKPGVVALQEIR